MHLFLFQNDAVSSQEEEEDSIQSFETQDCSNPEHQIESSVNIYDDSGTQTKNDTSINILTPNSSSGTDSKVESDSGLALDEQCEQNTNQNDFTNQQTGKDVCHNSLASSSPVLFTTEKSEGTDFCKISAEKSGNDGESSRQTNSNEVISSLRQLHRIKAKLARAQQPVRSQESIASSLQKFKAPRNCDGVKSNVSGKSSASAKDCVSAIDANSSVRANSSVNVNSGLVVNSGISVKSDINVNSGVNMNSGVGANSGVSVKSGSSGSILAGSSLDRLKNMLRRGGAGGKRRVISGELHADYGNPLDQSTPLAQVLKRPSTPTTPMVSKPKVWIGDRNTTQSMDTEDSCIDTRQSTDTGDSCRNTRMSMGTEKSSRNIRNNMDTEESRRNIGNSMDTEDSCRDIRHRLDTDDSRRNTKLNMDTNDSCRNIKLNMDTNDSCRNIKLNMDTDDSCRNIKLNMVTEDLHRNTRRSTDTEDSCRNTGLSMDTDDSHRNNMQNMDADDSCNIYNSRLDNALVVESSTLDHGNSVDSDSRLGAPHLPDTEDSHKEGATSSSQDWEMFQCDWVPASSAHSLSLFEVHRKRHGDTPEPQSLSKQARLSEKNLRFVSGDLFPSLDSSLQAQAFSQRKAPEPQSGSKQAKLSQKTLSLGSEDLFPSLDSSLQAQIFSQRKVINCAVQEKDSQPHTLPTRQFLTSESMLQTAQSVDFEEVFRSLSNSQESCGSNQSSQGHSTDERKTGSQLNLTPSAEELISGFKYDPPYCHDKVEKNRNLQAFKDGQSLRSCSKPMSSLFGSSSNAQEKYSRYSLDQSVRNVSSCEMEKGMRSATGNQFDGNKACMSSGSVNAEKNHLVTKHGEKAKESDVSEGRTFTSSNDILLAASQGFLEIRDYGASAEHMGSLTQKTPKDSSGLQSQSQDFYQFYGLPKLQTTQESIESGARNQSCDTSDSGQASIENLLEIDTRNCSSLPEVCAKQSEDSEESKSVTAPPSGHQGELTSPRENVASDDAINKIIFNQSCAKDNQCSIMVQKSHNAPTPWEKRDSERIPNILNNPPALGTSNSEWTVDKNLLSLKITERDVVSPIPDTPFTIYQRSGHVCSESELPNSSIITKPMSNLITDTYSLGITDSDISQDANSVSVADSDVIDGSNSFVTSVTIKDVDDTCNDTIGKDVGPFRRQSVSFRNVQSDKDSPSHVSATQPFNTYRFIDTNIVTLGGAMRGEQAERGAQGCKRTNTESQGFSHSLEGPSQGFPDILHSTQGFDLGASQNFSNPPKIPRICDKNAPGTSETIGASQNFSNPEITRICGKNALGASETTGASQNFSNPLEIPRICGKNALGTSETSRASQNFSNPEITRICGKNALSASETTGASQNFSNPPKIPRIFGKNALGTSETTAAPALYRVQGSLSADTSGSMTDPTRSGKSSKQSIMPVINPTHKLNRTYKKNELPSNCATGRVALSVKKSYAQKQPTLDVSEMERETLASFTATDKTPQSSAFAHIQSSKEILGTDIENKESKTSTGILNNEGSTKHCYQTIEGSTSSDNQTIEGSTSSDNQAIGGSTKTDNRTKEGSISTDTYIQKSRSTIDDQQTEVSTNYQILKSCIMTGDQKTEGATKTNNRKKEGSTCVNNPNISDSTDNVKQLTGKDLNTNMRNLVVSSTTNNEKVEESNDINGQIEERYASDVDGNPGGSTITERGNVQCSKQHPLVATTGELGQHWTCRIDTQGKNLILRIFISKRNTKKSHGPRN